MNLPKNVPITNPDYDLVDNIYSFTLRDINGVPVKLDKYKGNIVLIVNVTSKSKHSEWSYQMLNELHDKFADIEGLRILAFPCNQFNNEEPGTNTEIKKFCQARNVKFDVFSKVNVNCDEQHPLWKFLKESIKKSAVYDKCKKGDPFHKCIGFCNCNYKLCVITEPFTKFLVNRDGVPVKRFGPEILSYEIIEAMEPYFNTEKYAKKRVRKEEAVLNAIGLPPPLPEDNRPCIKTWYFTPGRLERL